MTSKVLEFRLGPVLATSFTGTLSERYGIAVERIPTPDRLRDWFVVSGLPVIACTDNDLDTARRLREAIHMLATAVALRRRPAPDDLAIVNDCSERGRASAILTADVDRRWALSRGSDVVDALGVVAADAVDIVSGERTGRLAICSSSTCRAVFFDTSQSRTRRWCDMNTCGNRQKKARIAAKTWDGASR